jgi:hypothetical protein
MVTKVSYSSKNGGTYTKTTDGKVTSVVSNAGGGSTSTSSTSTKSGSSSGSSKSGSSGGGTTSAVTSVPKGSDIYTIKNPDGSVSYHSSTGGYTGVTTGGTSSGGGGGGSSSSGTGLKVEEYNVSPNGNELIVGTKYFTGDITKGAITQVGQVSYGSSGQPTSYQTSLITGSKPLEFSDSDTITILSPTQYSEAPKKVSTATITSYSPQMLPSKSTLLTETPRSTLTAYQPRSVGSIWGEAVREAKGGDIYEAGKVLYTGLVRPQVGKVVAAAEASQGTIFPTMTQFGKMTKDYSIAATGWISEGVEKVGVGIQNRITKGGAITDKEREKAMTTLAESYSGNQKIVEDNIRKFNEKYGGVNLTQAEYKQAVKDQKKLDEQIKILDAQGRSVGISMKKLKGDEGRLTGIGALSTGVVTGVLTLPTSITGLVGSVIEKPISTTAKLPAETIIGIKGLVDVNTPLSTRIRGTGSLIGQVVGGELIGGLGTSMLAKSKIPAKKGYTPKVSTSIEVENAFLKGKNELGQSIWDVRSKVYTDLFNPKTGKLVDRFVTNVKSESVVAASKTDAITASIKSQFATKGSRATRIVKDAQGNIIGATTKADIGQAVGGASIYPAKQGGIYIGGGYSQVKQTGVLRGRVFEKGGDMIMQIEKQMRRKQPQQASTSNLISKKLGESPSVMERFGYKFKGMTEYFAGRTRTDIYPESFYVKGYKKGGDGMLFTKNVRGYLRRPKKSLTGSREKIPSMEASFKVGKAFTPEELIYEIGDVRQVKPIRKFGGRDFDAGGGVRQTLRGSEGEAVLSSVNEQLGSISKALERKYVKPRKAPGVTKGAKAITESVKQKGFLMTQGLTGFGVAVTLRERSITSTPSGLNLVSIGGLDTRTKFRDDGAYKGTFIPAEMTREGVIQKESQSSALIQSPVLSEPQIQQPITNISPTISITRPSTPTPIRPEEMRFLDPEGRRKKEKGYGFGYDTQVKIDATQGQKVRWVTIANNVPLITAKSIGGKFVDETASNQFRVVKQKSAASKIIDTTWNVLQKKFREYSSKGGVRVSSRPNYIEKRAYRIDTEGERRAIPQASISRRFRR